MSTEPENPQREEILSPEETDALLQGIEDGSVETSRGHGRPAGEVNLYDFSDCERMARGTMPTLQVINTRIARRLRDTFSELLHKPVEVDAGINQIKRYGEHMPTIAMPASLNLVQMRPFSGTLLMVPQNKLIYMTVDSFFGGKGIVEDNPPAREFTQVEQRMITLLLEQIFDAVTYGWQPVLAVSPELIGQEQNPHFAAVASAGDRVIVNEFVVKLGETTASLQFIMPRAMLEPVEELLDAAPRNDKNEPDGKWLKALSDRLADTLVSIDATLTETTLKLGDVLNLAAGDVIPVKLPDQIILNAVGIPMFTGRAGAASNHNAVEITGRADYDPTLIQHRENS